MSHSVSRLKLGQSQDSLSANLKELHPDAGEHELQQGGDDHDVANSSDGHKHTLHHMLQDTETVVETF